MIPIIFVLMLGKNNASILTNSIERNYSVNIWSCVLKKEKRKKRQSTLLYIWLRFSFSILCVRTHDTRSCAHTHRVGRSRYLCAALTFSLPSIHFFVPRKPQVITQPMQVECERCDMKSSLQRVLAKGQLQSLGKN